MEARNRAAGISEKVTAREKRVPPSRVNGVGENADDISTVFGQSEGGTQDRRTAVGFSRNRNIKAGTLFREH